MYIHKSSRRVGHENLLHIMNLLNKSIPKPVALDQATSMKTRICHPDHVFVRYSSRPPCISRLHPRAPTLSCSRTNGRKLVAGSNSLSSSSLGATLLRVCGLEFRLFPSSCSCTVLDVIATRLREACSCRCSSMSTSESTDGLRLCCLTCAKGVVALARSWMAGLKRDLELNGCVRFMILAKITRTYPRLRVPCSC